MRSCIYSKSDINPHTGEFYKLNQKGYKEGDLKGGKLEGNLTEYAAHGAHPVSLSQISSFVLSQARGMMPIAIQNLWQIASGENDATSSILNASGSGVLTNSDPDKK